MKILHIFECSNNKLFAAQFEGEGKNSLELLYDQWTDTEYLKEFFNQYDKDFRKFYGNVKLNQRILDTMDEADRLFEELYDLCDEENDISLDELFKPLDNLEKDNDTYELQKLKGKGPERKSYLRIYAIRYNNSYIITGGTIKLTQYMKQRPHTKLELIKLEAVKQFLQNDEIEGQFVYLNI